LSKYAARKAAPRPKPVRSPADLIREVEELSGELYSLLDSAAVVGALATRLVEKHGADVAAIWQMVDGTSSLDLAAQFGDPAIPSSLSKVPQGQGILGQAARHRLPQLLESKPKSRDALFSWAQQHALRFVSAFPLLIDSKVLGVLLVGSKRALGRYQVALFRVHARLAAMALHDAALLSSTQQTLNKLRFLVEASKALSSTLDLSELLSRILDVAKSQIECERGTLFLVDEKSQEIWSLIAHGLEKQEIRLPLGKGIAGHVAKSGEVVNIPDAYADPRFNPEVDKRTGYRTRNILCLPIRNKSGKIIAALQLLNKIKGPFTNEDAEFLLTLSGHMALALENAQLHQELIDKERMEKELALARGIQRSLLPETTPFVEGFDIALLNEPCFAVGGDYYDFMNLGPNTLLVVIADVEGKGVSSALVMSNLQAALRALVLHLHSLDEIADAINHKILTDTRAKKYLTMFLGLIDLRRKGLHYINCGHVPPVIVRAKEEPILLTEGGMVIGLFENVTYERGYKKLQSGDVLALCTDGITEAMDVQQDEYGTQRLYECIQRVAEKKATEIVAEVNADVTRFSRHGTHIDDKVMIAIKVE
jgi:phosphoserine phosphatase RsbU/P